VLAVLWSTVSHWVLGVPFDLVVRARRGQEQAARDLRILTEVNVNRILSLAEYSGPIMTAGAAFMLTGLATLGWGYESEFSQAVFLLALPMVFIGLLSIRTANKLRDSGFEDVPGALRWHRLSVQMLGVVFIFITAFWGMWVNVTVSPLSP